MPMAMEHKELRTKAAGQCEKDPLKFTSEAEILAVSPTIGTTPEVVFESDVKIDPAIYVFCFHQVILRQPKGIVQIMCRCQFSTPF